MSSKTSRTAPVNASHCAKSSGALSGVAPPRQGAGNIDDAPLNASCSSNRVIAIGAARSASHSATGRSLCRSAAPRDFTTSSYAFNALKNSDTPPSTSRLLVVNVESSSYVSVFAVGKRLTKNSYCVGKTTFINVECQNNFIVVSLYPPCINVRISCVTRIDEAFVNIGAYARNPARSSLVIVNPCRAASRMARNIRTGSSRKLLGVSSTHRTIPAMVSYTPPVKSNISFRNGS
mmetsp:Transcript_6481/g.23463  ORF Transcript_6481/g.23463 Transcript_6481/m.23463 type:complete len:234 (-) Transcript_6481:809-1510(-)